MKLALDQFSENVARAKSLAGLARSLSGLTTEAVEISDIYRASLVLGVSALDYFVHEFVRLGMLEIHRGKRAATDAHLSFRVSIAAARTGIANTAQDDWLDQAIREAHSWLSFQHPDKIADAIRLVSAIKLWEAVATELNTQATEVKTGLSTIVDRRNKIAHEADMDPTNPGFRWPIDSPLVEEALDFIGKTVDAIYKVVA